jgi:hypothetical protein
MSNPCERRPMMEHVPAGNVEFRIETRESGEDGGPSIQVRTADGGEDVQLLRFDCFRTRPHYHYAPGLSGPEYDMDPTLLGDSLEWAISQIRANLGAMVDRAGYPTVATGLDRSAIAAGLAQVEAYFARSKASATP